MKDKLYKMMNWPEIEAIVYGEEGKPQSILGRHSVSNYTLFQTFQPDSKDVKLIVEDDDKEYSMEMADEEGFYAIAILGKIKGAYHYIVTDLQGKKHKVVDPYDFEPEMKAEDVKAFRDGTMYDAYKVMGAHVCTIKKVKGTVFRVWAPNAIRVSVVGEFNDWNGKSHPMMKDESTGLFSLFVPGISQGVKYKYELSVKGGNVYTKLDPYAIHSSDSGSIIEESADYKWDDAGFYEKRTKFDTIKSPLAIYEADLKTIIDEAESLTDYAAKVAEKGFGYVELNPGTDGVYELPVNVSTEKICDMVAAFHAAGIGVILQWNPCGFSLGEEGLKVFDGTYLYGHLDDRRRYNPACDGFNYNYGRPEVDDYLLAGACFWFEQFHIDGMHIDGLSSILYLDYGKYDGEWSPNIYGGHENLEAIEFIKHLNSILHKKYEYCITTTKEVGAFPRVTERLDAEGLGFDYIRNNGYSEDYLEFLKKDGGLKDMRKLTDNMAYAYSENYILTISKDDVIASNEYDYLRVDNGASYFDYIPIADEGKDAVRRATLAYMYAHPGKKLIYSGQEDDAEIKRLNELYKSQNALSSLDSNPYGFEWIGAIDHKDGVISFMRKDEYLNHSIFVVCNFSDNEYANYKFGMPYEGKYKMIFTSDDKKFGGASTLSTKAKETKEEFYDGRANSLTLKVAPMSVAYYSYTPYTEEELLKIAEAKVKKFKERLEQEARAKAKELNSGIRK